MKISLSKKYCWLMFFLSTIFFFYEFILRVSPGVMTNELMRAYQIDAKSLGFMSSVFFQAYAWMQIPVGVIFDKYSPRKILTWACFLCACGALLFAATPFFWVAVMGRLFIGFSAAFGFIGVLKVAEQWLPLQKFGLITGLLICLGFVGAIVSDNILGWFIQSHTWSSSMIYLSLFGMLLSGSIYCIVKDSPSLQQIQHNISWQQIKSGILNVIKSPYIWVNGLIGFCLYFPTSAFAELWGKSFLMTVSHLNNDQAVFAVTTIFLGWAIGGPITGWLSDFFHKRRLFFIIGSIGAAISIALVIYGQQTSFLLICILLMLFGFFSSVQGINFAYAREISAIQFTATAMATTNMIEVLGGAFSQPIIGVMLDAKWNGLIENGVRMYSSSNYTYAFALLPIALIVAALLALFLKKTDYENLRK